MTQGEDRLKAFEARLAAIRAKTEAGLAQRADALEAAGGRWAGGDTEAGDEVRRIAHKIRGIAAGQERLGQLAAQVEEAASGGEPALDAIAALVLEARNIAEAAQVVIPPPSLPTSEPTAGRVLVVDDDPAILRMMEMALSRLGGFDVVAISNDQDARAAISGGSFDVVLLDAMMPHTTGLELCRHARSQPCQKDARIIILSAATAQQLGWEDEPQGPDAWWHKPLPPKEAVERIRALIET